MKDNITSEIQRLEEYVLLIPSKYIWVNKLNMIHFYLQLLFPSFVKEGNLKTADVRPCVCPSVRPSVRPGSDLRDGWMDLSETHIWYSLVSQGYARHFKFLKLSKMADWRPFSEL